MVHTTQFSITSKDKHLAIHPPTKDMLNFRNVICGLIHKEKIDLAFRQMGVLLTCYTTEDPQTVRGLAAQLKINKPAITRALDRLAAYGLIRRRQDPADRRSVLIAITPTGNRFMQRLQVLMTPLSSVETLIKIGPTPSSIIVTEVVAGKKRVGRRLLESAAKARDTMNTRPH
jgi:DNA-binding MarR family transcriptional regulator